MDGKVGGRKGQKGLQHKVPPLCLLGMPESRIPIEWMKLQRRLIVKKTYVRSYIHMENVTALISEIALLINSRLTLS